MSPTRAATAVILGVGAVLGAAAAAEIAAAFEPDSVAFLGLQSLGIEWFLALAALACALFWTQPVAQRLGLNAGRLSAGSIGIGVIGGLGLSFALDGIVFHSGLYSESNLADLDALFAGARGSGLLWALIGIGVAPGIGEELLCRGLLQRGFERRMGPGWAIVLAAAIFGALHVEAVHAGFTALIGLYLGAVAWLAGSIRPAIAIHIVNNLVAVLSAAWFPAGRSPVWSIPIGLGLAGISLWILWDRHRALQKSPNLVDP
jgi:membrane protease YdiL (CAAX protease family)